jgi:hypothetical protein
LVQLLLQLQQLAQLLNIGRVGSWNASRAWLQGSLIRLGGLLEDKLEAQGMFLELLFRGRKAAEPDPVKNLEKTAPVTVWCSSAGNCG